MDSQFNLLIAPDGEVTAIYNDILASLLEQGKARIERASHVEPESNSGSTSWLAKMNNGDVLGPYKLRSEALAAEVEYLNQRLF